MPTYLYRHTLADARRWGEMDLYKESLQANIDCRHAIEEQIRENHDGLHMKTDVSALCREYGIDRVGWVLAATVQEADWDGRYRSGNREWANGIHIEDTRRTDYRISSHPELVNGFINQYRSFLQKLDLHDRTACTEESSYAGKVLILRADVLTDRYKLGDYQYFYAVSGFGCEPDKLGRNHSTEPDTDPDGRAAECRQRRQPAYDRADGAGNSKGRSAGETDGRRAGSSSAL